MDASPVLLSSGMGLRTDYPRNATLVELFSAHVERAPEAPAVVFGDESLTYAELDRRANQLARHLTGLGVGPGSLVGLCMERSADLIVSLLGMLKTGGAYLPLDPSSPAERLRWMLWMLEDTGVRSRSRTAPSKARRRRPRAGPDEGDSSGSRPPCAGRQRERPRLRDVHLGLHRPAQGSGDPAPGDRAARRRRGLRLTSGPGDRMLQASTPVLRRLDLRDLGSPPERRLPGGPAARRLPLPASFGDCAAEARGSRVLLTTAALFHQVAREVPGAFSGVREACLGRRGGRSPSAARGARARRAWPAVNLLRPHRKHDRRNLACE